MGPRLDGAAQIGGINVTEDSGAVATKSTAIYPEFRTAGKVRQCCAHFFLPMARATHG